MRLLRHPEVIQLLLKELFHPQKPPLDSAVLPRYVHLLAFISAAVDHRDEQPAGPLDQAAVGAAETAIRAALPLCKSNPIGLELQSKMEELFNRITHPLGAAAVLTMVAANLLDCNYYITPYATVSTPIYLSLLRVVRPGVRFSSYFFYCLIALWSDCTALSTPARTRSSPPCELL